MVTPRKMRNSDKIRARLGLVEKPKDGLVYGYTRVSHQDSASTGLSIKAQKQSIKHWYKMLRFKNRRLRWGSMITDKVESAYTKVLVARPGGKELNKRLKAGDHVIFSKLDRGFRNTVDCLRSLAQWHERGVTVHFIDLQLDTSTAMGKMMLTILAALAEWESARKSERTREALAIKRMNGERIGCDPPYGLKVKPMTNGPDKVVKDKRRLALCRWSWLLRKKTGWGGEKIANHIEKILAARENRKYKPEGFSREWSNQSVRIGIIRYDQWLVNRVADPDAPFVYWRAELGTTLDQVDARNGWKRRNHGGGRNGY